MPADLPDSATFGATLTIDLDALVSNWRLLGKRAGTEAGAVVKADAYGTGIEAAVDRIGPEHHELSGRAKDIGSAAVFVALLNAAVVWVLILLT